MNFAFYIKYITAAYIILNVFRRKTQMRVSKNNTYTNTKIHTKKYRPTWPHTLYSLIINSQYQNSYASLLIYIVQCLLHYHTRCIQMDHKFTAAKIHGDNSESTLLRAT